MEQTLLLDQAGRTLLVIGLILIALLIPVLVVGLIVGVLQAATSISEQTLSFLPKLIVFGIALLAFASAIVALLSGFTHEIFEAIANVAR